MTETYIAIYIGSFFINALFICFVELFELTGKVRVRADTKKSLMVSMMIFIIPFWYLLFSIVTGFVKLWVSLPDDDNQNSSK